MNRDSINPLSSSKLSFSSPMMYLAFCEIAFPHLHQDLPSFLYLYSCLPLKSVLPASCLKRFNLIPLEILFKHYLILWIRKVFLFPFPVSLFYFSAKYPRFILSLLCLPFFVPANYPIFSVHLAFNLVSCKFCEDVLFITIANPGWNVCIEVRVKIYLSRLWPDGGPSLWHLVTTFSISWLIWLGVHEVLCMILC